MPEVVQIALSQFVKFGLLFALVYGVYRLVRFVISRLPAGIFKKETDDTWDGVQLLYSVPSNIFGFLIMDYLIISIVVILIDEGMRDIFRFELLTAPWGIFTNGMDTILGIIGCAGIFAATVFGIYNDYPPTRLKILGVVAFFAALVGIGLRFS